MRNPNYRSVNIFCDISSFVPYYCKKYKIINHRHKRDTVTDGDRGRIFHSFVQLKSTYSWMKKKKSISYRSTRLCFPIRFNATGDHYLRRLEITNNFRKDRIQSESLVKFEIKGRAKYVMKLFVIKIERLKHTYSED